MMSASSNTNTFNFVGSKNLSLKTQSTVVPGVPIMMWDCIWVPRASKTSNYEAPTKCTARIYTLKFRNEMPRYARPKVN